MILEGLLFASIHTIWLFRTEVGEQYVQKMEIAVKSGDSQAEVCLGEVKQAETISPQGAKEALALYQSAAAKGSQRAKELIAQMYMSGQGGLKQDTRKALAGFNDLIAHGYLRAATDLGVYSLSGSNPTISDYKNALIWFKKGFSGGDPYAAVAISRMYALGLGVPKSKTIAKKWADKAAIQPVACLIPFLDLSTEIIMANAELPAVRGDTLGHFTMVYKSKNGKGVDPHIVDKSNDPNFDSAWLSAVKAANLPAWPKNFAPDNYYVGFGVTSNAYWFLAMVEHAIQSELILPKQILLNGSKGTGRATVEFDFLDGKVSQIKLKNSTGDKLEDAAVLKAVTEAQYPLPPKEYAGRKLRLMAPVNFYLPAISSKSKAPPAVATLIH